MVYNYINMDTSSSSTFGANPLNVKWTVVRGDTASFRIYFYQADGVTLETTSGWTFSSSAYNPKSNTTSSLTVTPGVGYADVLAPANVTSTWGTGYSGIVAELTFDLQVVKADLTKWTPILGTIVVMPDVTLT